MSIVLENVTKTFKSGEVSISALRDVSIEIDSKQIVTILGPSGSGKSTLLNMIGGIDQPDSGTVMVSGEKLDAMKQSELTLYRRNRVGFIFQQYNLIPTLTVRENIEVGKELSKQPLNIDDMMKQIGMWERRNKFPYQLSGGEQQRVAIARALIKNPEYLLCDEPTGALDEETGKKILKLLQSVHENYGATIMIITHNQGIGEMAHRVIRMGSGEIIENAKNENRLDAEKVTWA